MVRIWAPVAAAAIVAAAPAASDDAARRFRFQGEPNLRIATDDAHVRVRPGPPDRVEILVRAPGWTFGPRGLRIVESQEGSRISFEVREPRVWIGWHRRQVEVEVTAPPNLEMVVTTGDGHVSLAGFAGRIEVLTGDGNVDAEELRGEIVLATGDGRVLGRGLDGRLRARSGDGRIGVTGRFDALTVSTGDGQVDVEAIPRSRVAEEWRLTSGDGPIVLRLPEGLEADLDVHTGDGQVWTDVPVEVLGRVSSSAIRGRMNGGGERMVVRTGDGSIRIEER
jgi:hypothetical protein